jgi:hypothetical protein
MNRRDVDNKIQLAKGGYADPENNTHVLHIDGQNWYLEKIDSTHFYMSNAPESRGMAHHIGQHNGEPYYDEVRTWLKETGGQYAKGGNVDADGGEAMEFEIYDEESGKTLFIVAHSNEEAEGISETIDFNDYEEGDVINVLDDIANYDEYDEDEDEYAHGGKFPKRSMNIHFTDDFFEQGRGNNSMIRIDEFPDPSFFVPRSSNVKVGDKVEFRRDPSGRMSDNIYYGTVVEINGGMAKIDHQNSNMKNVIREVAVSELKKYAKGGSIAETKADADYIITMAYTNGIHKSENTLSEFTKKVTEAIKRNGYRLPNKKAFEVAYQAYKFAKGGEVSIPNADKMMHLPMEVAVYVPSTSNVDKEISATEMKARVKEVETYLAELFGGFTSSEKVGGYLSGNSGVITEKVVPVTAFATNESFAKNKSKLVNKLAVWAKRWSQEAMGLEFEGDLYYVPQKFKKGGRLTATYIPNEDIESIKTRFGQTFSGKDVLDGAYVKRKVKTPKVARYMFEEEEYEYAEGGVIFKKGDLVVLKDGGSQRNAVILEDGFDSKNRVRVRPDGIPMDISVPMSEEYSSDKRVYVLYKRFENGGVFEEGNPFQGKLSGTIIDVKGVMYFVGMKIGEMDVYNDVYEIFRAGSLQPYQMSENKMREFGNKFAHGGMSSEL